MQTFNAPNQGGVIAIKVFTASGTYTPSPNMTTAVVEAVGSGAGGGGCTGLASPNQFGGGGGGSGGYSKSTLTAAQIGAIRKQSLLPLPEQAARLVITMVRNGGDVSFGALVIAKGGGGGTYGTSGVVAHGGIGGVFGTGDFTSPGSAGVTGFYANINTVTVECGQGASSIFGGGGRAADALRTATNGTNATGYGSGGGGAFAPNAITKAGGNGSSGVVIITEYGITSLSSTAAAQGAVRYDLAQGLTAPQQAQAQAGPFIVTFRRCLIRSYLAGLTLSTAGASASFSIAAGVAADSTNAAMMTLATAISKTTGAWTTGSGVGALDTGGIAPNTWYHVYLIKRVSDGITDILFSLSPTTPTLTLSFTLFRRIGSMLTNASSQWTLFRQDGDVFTWDALVNEVALASVPNTSAVPVTLAGTPNGIRCCAFGSCIACHSGSRLRYCGEWSRSD